MRTKLFSLLLLFAALSVSAQTTYSNLMSAMASSAAYADNALVTRGNLLSVTTPRMILWGDSQSTQGTWLAYVRSNSIWANRAPIINLAWPGQPFASLMANRTNQTTQYISPISNLTYLLNYCSVRNTDTNVAMTNFLNLWAWADANGVRVIQFGFNQSSDAAINNFLRTNSSRYYKYVEATNFTTSDGVHADGAGSLTIANKFLSVTTNFIPIVNAPLRGVGESVLQAGETNSPVALRVHGQIVSAHTLAYQPYPAFVDNGYWFSHIGADTHIGIIVSNETVNPFEDMSFLTSGIERMRIPESGQVEWYAGGRFYDTTSNARTTDKRYLRIGYQTTEWGIRSLAEGAASYLPIKIDGGGTTFLWFNGAPSTGIGINTNNPAAPLHVNGAAIVQGQLDAGVFRSFVTGSAAVTDQEYLRVATLGTNFIEIKSLGAGAGLFRDLALSSGSALLSLSARTSGVGIGTTNPAANFAFHVPGSTLLGGLSATNLATNAAPVNGLGQLADGSFVKIPSSAGKFVESFFIPLGAFTISNETSQATVTNFFGKDALGFADTATNTAVIQFTFPDGWDEGAFRIAGWGRCSGTNSASATKIVWAFDSYMAPDPSDISTNLYGTATWSTNNVGVLTNQARFTTGDITPGGTISKTNLCQLRVSRLGGQAADSLTNSLAHLAQGLQVYFYKYRTNAAMPTASSQ